MPNNLIPELITEIAKEFTEHLAIPDNSRILFSGKFGKGKTTFLEQYFKADSPYNKSGITYNVFHLKPVNYSVASNEDIFRYIKYDIILEFLRKNVNAESYDFTFLEVLPHYILKQPYKIIRPFIEYTPKVGKLLDEFIRKLEKMYEDINKYKDKINDSSDANILADFLQRVETDDYSLYENDVTTKIMGKILEQQKESNERSENILIIDDLDRIDPEHIFRLLNIFSAHFDFHYSLFGKDNKFGFDKVILVCDVDNIRNIFGNKYGLNVDFKGYLDKFYSSNIFHFNNHFQLLKASRSILIQTKSFIDNMQFDFFTTNQSSKFNFFELVNNSLKLDLLSLRNVLNFRDTPPSFASIISFENDINTDIKHFTFFVEVKALTHLFGNYQALLKAITQMEELDIPITDVKVLFKSLIFYYYYKSHNFKRPETDVDISLVGRNLVAKIRINYESKFTVHIPNPQVPGGAVEYEPSTKDYYILLKAVLAKLNFENFLI